MTTQYAHFPKNTFFVTSEVNKPFEEVLAMSEPEFRQWIIDVRAKIVEIWDTHGIPPRPGYTADEIVEQFDSLFEFKPHKMFVKDELSGGLCIRNTHNKLGNACNSWFPTMEKTKIDYGGKNSKPRSIYDFMKEDDLLEKYMPYGRRHFKRDSFYAYSQCITLADGLPGRPGIKIDNAVDWIEKFDSQANKDTYGFWLQEKDAGSEYTGYNEDLIGKEFLALTYDEVDAGLKRGIIPQLAISNIDLNQKTGDRFLIRLYEKKTKIFPVGLKSFRISVCQSAVNFPPPIAKAIWEKYTEEFKKDQEVVVWDPSCGWGGRILGAMSVKDDRKIMYLGTDPNPDHIIPNSETTYTTYTKYDDLARFVNIETKRGHSLDPSVNNWRVWSKGSEVIQFDPGFQHYKGKVSVVFTSPPYFGKEQYSEDQNQSCHKFSGYQEWKQGFLYETLKTAYDWLRPGGYILWNISDIAMGKDVLPLEKDSCDIMESFGMKHVETLRMILGQMPGSGRTKKDSNGEIVSTNRNSARLNGTTFRYEPIFIYKK